MLVEPKGISKVLTVMGTTGLFASSKLVVAPFSSIRTKPSVSTRVGGDEKRTDAECVVVSTGEVFEVSVANMAVLSPLSINTPTIAIIPIFFISFIPRYRIIIGFLYLMTFFGEKQARSSRYSSFIFYVVKGKSTGLIREAGEFSIGVSLTWEMTCSVVACIFMTQRIV